MKPTKNKSRLKMSKTIMTVDDSASIRQMVSFTLQEEDYNVIEASDGKDALSKMNGGNLDLIITDLNMPNMNGIELIKVLRMDPTHQYIPIIMLTTESQNHKKMEGKAAGATGWLVKPFVPEQLVQVVKKVIG
jgi:two-component system chemotaxis response regulator CheY